MTWETLYWKSLESLLPVVLLLLSAALTYAVAWLRKKTEALKNADLRATLDHTVGQLKDALYTSVDAVSQQWIYDIKAARADGKLTPEEQKRAKEAAIAAFQNRLIESQKAVAERFIGDLALWAGDEIEAYLARKKRALDPRPAGRMVRSG